MPDLPVISDPTGAIGAATIAAVVAFVTALVTSFVTFRSLKLQLRANYRAGLARRQLAACEAVWEIFGPTSRTDGEHRVIRDFYAELPETPILDVPETEAFLAKFQETFSSKAGLYLSESTRDTLHDFRDCLIKLKNKPQENNGKPEERILTREEANKFHELRKEARLALRREVGTINLTVARAEYTAY